MSATALKMQHNSLQFSDTPKQQRFDVNKIFVRGGQFPIKTGTEAGGGTGGMRNREYLEEFAKRYNHVLNFAGDAWVAVNRDIIKRGSLVKDDLFLVSNDEFDGGIHGANRVMPWLGFDHVNGKTGHLSVGSVHYPTKGGAPGSPNFDLNMKIAYLLGEWFEEVAQGTALGFLNGDFNMPDRTADWAGKDGNFTSMADYLRSWQNTGHGPIDGFCSYDHDGRVKAQRFTVLDDKEFKLFSDHFTCRGTWQVTDLKGAA